MTNENGVKVKKESPKWLWIIGGILLFIVVNTLVRVIFNTPTITPTLVPEPLIPAHFITYADKTGLFSISYPPDWELALEEIEFLEQFTKKLIESIESGLSLERASAIFFAGVPTEIGWSPNVSIAVEPLPRAGWTLDKYVEAATREVKNLAEDYHEFSRVRTTVDGKEAVVIEYEANLPNIGKTHALLMMMIVEKTGWAITCAPEFGRFNEYEDDCYAIVRSLRILK